MNRLKSLSLDRKPNTATYSESGRGGSLIPGLRMFTAQPSADSAGECEMFYSRRSTGPFYRWRTTAPERWEVTRVNGGDLLAAGLCPLSWKNLPQTLQLRVVNHYEE